MSVDALRGFDMFWIIGAGPLVKALKEMHEGPATEFLATQLQHVQWEGFRFYDLIFPLFLFLVGVSSVFSLDKTIAQAGRAKAIARVIRRSVLLFALGVFYYGGLSARWPDIQLAGVLQRIAACYLAAGLIYCTVRSSKAMAIIASALLVGYWGLVAYVPFPDLKLDKQTIEPLVEKLGTDSPAALAVSVSEHVTGVYEEGRNLTNYVDFRFLPGKKSQTWYINEGLLSTMPSIAICLFGIFTGRLLQRDDMPGLRKVTWLFASGVVGVLVGWLWSHDFPLIKRIWTSSFCLMASGYSVLLLAVFYLVIDVWKRQRWCQPFVWIGTNSITIYLAVKFISFPKLAEGLVGGDVKHWLDGLATGLGSLLVALVGLALAVLLCWFLHHRRIFLRL